MSVNLRLGCSECDATLTAPTTKVLDATRWAEENHRWVALGTGGHAGFLCPKHEVVCTRCGHGNTTEQEIAVRQQRRQEAAERMAERMAWRRR